VESVRASGADVKVFSSLHTSGERAFVLWASRSSSHFRNRTELHLYSGVAAILKYALHDLEDAVDSGDDATAAAAAAAP
jgi:hypothetical protein